MKVMKMLRTTTMKKRKKKRKNTTLTLKQKILLADLKTI